MFSNQNDKASRNVPRGRLYFVKNYLCFDRFFHSLHRGFQPGQHLLLHHILHARDIGHSGRDEHRVHLQDEFCAVTIFFENIGIGHV
jgi:hypothetical protein